jgi:hypothetical protein
MSHIRVNIERLVLKRFEPLEGKALSNELEAQLQHVLANPATRSEWAHSHRTPVMTLGTMPLEGGKNGPSKFARCVAQAVGRGLKP